MDDYIKIDMLKKSFNDNDVLKGVTLEMKKNESLVVIGRSGCGKSVLLKHLNGLIEPDGGAIFFEGRDISKMKSKELVELRKNMGMLFQSAALLDSLTVGENIGLGLRESRLYSESDIKDIVEEKLKLVGLSGTSKVYPSELSGGMRKRVGLARAIATEPEVILYDEPTTGLDPITADIINDLILNLHDKLHVTSISVTHDMTSAYKIGQRIVMLYDGKIEFDGDPQRIQNSGNEVVDQFIHGRADGPIQPN
jgi:phospholipid/cholesterol/gamma-HCH transport system ATP-binding protein